MCWSFCYKFFFLNLYGICYTTINNYLLAATPLNDSVFTGTISLHIFVTLILFSSQFSKLFRTLDEFGLIVTVLAQIFENSACWCEIFTSSLHFGQSKDVWLSKVMLTYVTIISQLFQVNRRGLASNAVSRMCVSWRINPFISAHQVARACATFQCVSALGRYRLFVGDSEEFRFKTPSVLSRVAVSSCVYRR